MGYWKLLFFASHILTSFLSLSNGQPDFRYLVCGDNGSTSMFESNKNTVLSSIAPNIGRNGYYSSSVGQNSDRVNAIALCRGDVELDICRSCVNDSIHKLVQLCPNHLGAIGWYDKCMLRFSNFTILHQLDLGAPGPVWSPNNVSDSDVLQFNQSLRMLLDRLREQAKSGDSLRKFASGSTSGPAFQTIYALSQCTPDLSDIQCDNCLDGLAKEIPRCCNGRQGARILRPSCNLRFETERFYNETPPGKENSTTRTIYTIVVPIVVSVIIVVFICIFMTRKRKQWKLKKPKQKFEDVDEITRIETLQYDLDTIRTATNDFANSNKLGQGGFGAVYKGMLPNGKEVAVKRLSIDSVQGEHEFKNEVLLVVKLQHRNLVRLLGFCLEGTERLLVYEFLPNASLDHFIFDPVKRAYLDWDTRYKIIGGVAKGLLYLHEDSQLRIIHRDLKASNILLDAEMNPKIADFGMAKLFVLDEIQGNTSRIAGTYGYMATEYVMHGQFSVKLDVFSFGVLVLEIVSGQKNNLSRQGENVKDLLSYAWKNWQNRTTSNLIDPKMIVRSESNQDIIRCIHIGLLCVQENVADRPTMASVLLMLNSLSFTLAVPLEPAFFAFNNSDSEMPYVRGYSSSATQSNQSEGQSGLCSVNEASITELYPQ